MPRSVAEYLRHILDEIEYLSRTAQNTDKDTFLNDETLGDRSYAVLKSLARR